VTVTQDPADAQWYTVRCLFGSVAEDVSLYEERLTLWQADSLDAAIAMAEAEAAAFAETIDVEYLGLAQGYWLSVPPRNGAEVYALCRESDLPPDDYLDQFFDTGGERQRQEDEQ
jgi:hypothetical protein